MLFKTEQNTEMDTLFKHWLIVNINFCLKNFAIQKLHLDVQMGEFTVGHNTDRTKDSMEALENSLRHLTEQMIHITRQQEFQRVNKYFPALS